MTAEQIMDVIGWDMSPEGLMAGVVGALVLGFVMGLVALALTE